MDIKGFLLRNLFARWNRCPELEAGYTLVFPSPMDMPFLLSFALEGLKKIDTQSCKQILVVPDGWGDDGGAALRDVVRGFDDPRIELVELRRRDYFIIRRMKPPGSAATHWMQVVNTVKHARCEHIFLHDADAFFAERDGLERHYRECRDRQMNTLGVTARIDEFFTKLGYSIPGTWELMFSTRWARSRSPFALKGRFVDTPHGRHEFDSMLYPQYADYSAGKVGVMARPPEFVHFSGTIFTYRTFRERRREGKQSVDEFFRVLLLSIFQELAGKVGDDAPLPRPSELARGLTDLSAPVIYNSAVALREYPLFRAMMTQLGKTPVFQGERAQRIEELLAPFDEKFTNVGSASPVVGATGTRRHGLG